MTKRKSQPNSNSLANDPPIELVTTEDALADACAVLLAEGAFAFDTEFVMEDRYAPEVCVVQLATPDHVYVVDPLEGLNLAPVWGLVADPEVEVVVHAGMEDLALCQTQGGRTPQNVFDCQVACGLVTPQYPLSLSRMVRGFLSVRLHKSQTLTDWRCRPLTPKQLRYAADDVIYLPAIRKRLGAKLNRLDRQDWLDEEMARFCDPSTYARGTDEKVFRLKGAGGLDGLGLAIARELVSARDELAAHYNRPARVVVRDHLLVEIAKHRWTEAKEIRTLRGLNLRSQGIQALAEAVARGCELPPEQRPTPTPVDDETEQEAALALLTGAVIRSYCADAGIAPQMMGSKKDIRSMLCRMLRGQNSKAPSPLECGWRAQTVGKIVERVLAGELRVGVDHGDGGHVVVVD